MKSKINRTGALSLYKEVYTKTLNNIENLLNTDKDNTLAKFLVEETRHLGNTKIINFVRDTEASFHLRSKPSCKWTVFKSVRFSNKWTASRKTTVITK